MRRIVLPGTLLLASTFLAFACQGEPGADVTSDDAMATTADAPTAMGEYRAVPGWPSLPEGFEMGEAAGVDVDSQGRVWVFHRGAEHPILALDPETGEILASFGEEMEFANAHGLEVDHEDNIWVTDTQTHQVYKFSPEGELQLEVGERGVAGLDESHFDQPTDVDVAPNGDFYVSDGYGNSRVVRFDADGNFLAAWGEPGTGPGQFDLPHGITLGADGTVYVADRTNQRIQLFSPEGDFVEEWTNDAWARPWGLDFANTGELFVIDGGHMSPQPPHYANVLRVTPDGEVLESWSSYGPELGQLSWGHDVAVAEDDAVYTVEVRNNLRAQKFERAGPES